MERFKNILVVHEDGENGRATLARAVKLADRNGADLTLIRIIDQIPDDYKMLITAMTPDEIMQESVREQEKKLTQYVSSFAIPISVQVSSGREFIEIIRQVLKNGHDLVIKTARGMTSSWGMLFGSTAMHLLRKCPCPVWLVKPGSGERYRRIMAAVDVAPPEIGENDLNVKIIELAGSLARLEKSELHIVQAWEKPDETFLSDHLNNTLGDMNILLHESKNMHIQRLHDFLDDFDLQGLQYQEHVIPGWADDVIPEFAGEKNIDLIVMGTVCRTGIAGFFMGNTAEKILHRVTCSVLAVKPDDFTTPVSLEK